MDLFNGVYKGKKVLVTGHTGFKGSWLCLWLLKLGAQVAGFSKEEYPTDPCNFEVLNLKEKIKHYVGDIRNIDQLQKVFEDFKPQIVFHLAAQPIVRESFKEAKVTFDTNLGGTVNVLECVKATTNIEAAVMITSDKCYDNVGWDWGYRENDRLGGDDPYSASKACAELAVRTYIQSCFKDNTPQIATTRAGNVIGGGDWAQDRIVPDCIKAWNENKSVVIRKPEATRPWQHVLEPLSGYLWLGACLLNKRKGVSGEAFNFGPDEEVVKSVQQLIEMLSQSWRDAKWEHIAADHEKEATLLKLSCDKALRRLSWRPILNFEQTIELTTQWYQEYCKGGTDLYAFTLSQIDQYIKNAKQKNAVWTGGQL